MAEALSYSADGNADPKGSMVLAQAADAMRAVDAFMARAKTQVREVIEAAGGLDAAQHEAHGFAWYATYAEALRQLHGWADRAAAEGQLSEIEELILGAGFGEYLTQMVSGLAMSQGEIVRPGDIGLTSDDVDALRNAPAVETLMTHGYTAQVRARLATLLGESAGAVSFGQAGLDDVHTAMRDEMRRFSEAEVVPHAHEWHLQNEYIPLETITKMSELGVFGLSIPEAYGGMGLGKEAMCVVSEELSRGYIGVGSLGTRSEIAAELILLGGTDAQKETFLPRIASGEILPTAVFTEPNTGSDLASLRTRAEKAGDTYTITGQKTWITHPVRADLMTLLARTNPDEPGYKGLSMFLAEKPRGSDETPFPADGMSGGEIEVLGYRGMKEYEISFDGFEVPASHLLGGEEGQGFKQLMATFESARIQTAARAVGVAQAALDVGLSYALERKQFGKPIFAFPRVSNKLVWMAVETMIVRQLTYFAAREKDQDRRCDVEAGMAKLLAARVAWAASDNALQIHGGNGFALEYPISRVLCDARILNIFEGAAEIQAHVIVRRLLSDKN
ncbi:MAG: acyl-CoA dehydrogenase family protein [Pseudomonadota bacterium]